MNEKQKEALRFALETAMNTAPFYNVAVNDAGAGVSLSANVYSDGTITILAVVKPQKPNEATIPFNPNHTEQNFDSRKAA
jgi:hypothetical protein